MDRTLGFIIAVVVVGFVAVFLWLGHDAKSATETALASVLLTLVSIIASCVVSHFYYLKAKKLEVDQLTSLHDENLKTYARKAAEKVTNLSKELDRLSIYLKDYLDGEGEEENLAVVLNVRDERIAGAIHIVEMLRSVNDTSLSDWQGVIGDELEKKEEEAEEKREGVLLTAMEKIDRLLSEERGRDEKTHDEVGVLREIRELRFQIENAFLGHGLYSPSTRFNPRSRKRLVVCPSCNSDVSIVVSKQGNVRWKGYTCGTCRAKLVVRPDAHNNPVVEPRRYVTENVACPACNHTNAVNLENIGGATATILCAECRRPFKASWTADGQPRATLGAAKADINDDFVRRVGALLPAQPWEKGVHLTIAATMGAPPKDVQKAIQVLIGAGVFKQQVDGVLYDTAPAGESAASAVGRS